VKTGTVAANWIVAGTNDFNGDGMSDLIWRDTTGGGYSQWLSTGSSFAENVVTGSLPTDWTIHTPI
jgi:hypothetical protein